MRAVFYDNFGPAEVLRYGERPKPEAGPGQVLVRVAAAGVNPIDRRLRAGELQAYFQREWPIIPGFEFSGRIEALGEGVTGWQPGDDVVGLAFGWFLHHGTYADYLPVAATAIARKPAGISFIQGASVPLTALTAWQALVEFAGLEAGQTVFIQAGAGGLGSAAITIAKYRGAKVYTSTRARNFDYVRSLGADRPIDYSAENPLDAMRRLEPDGVDVVLGSLEAESDVQDAIRMVKTGGAVPYMNNDPPAMSEIATHHIRTEFLHNRPDGPMLDGLMQLYAAGKLTFPETSVLPLEAAAEAHRRSESWGTRGKIVLQVQDL